MKRLDIPCDFGGKKIPVSLYIGDPKKDSHPLHFQNKWLSDVKGGCVPQDVMDSIARIRDLAEKNNISFEDLCYFAVRSVNGELTESEENEEFKNILLFSDNDSNDNKDSDNDNNNNNDR